MFKYNYINGDSQVLAGLMPKRKPPEGGFKLNIIGLKLLSAHRASICLEACFQSLLRWKYQ